MHIAYLNPSAQLGGAEVALLDMLASIRLTAPNWKLELLASGEGPLPVKARLLGVTVTVLPFPRAISQLGDAQASSSAKGNSKWGLFIRLVLAAPFIAAYAIRLRMTLRRISPDVIHTNGFKMHILGALAKPANATLIWHIHDFVSRRPLVSRLIRLLHGRASIVLSNSNSVRADIESVCGDSVVVQTLYNAVDTDVFSPTGPRLDLDALAGLPPAEAGSVRVGMVATFARWKGQEIFMRALRHLSAGPHLRGYIIGGALYETDGSQYSLDELKAIAREHGISSRLGFTGFVEDAAAALRSLDIVVHASTEPEPFGLVIIESMACGRAVIVSDAGGASELFDAGITAVGHKPGDAVQLAECTTTLANDPRLRTRLGAAGRVAAERRFNSRRLAFDLIPIYQNLQASI